MKKVIKKKRKAVKKASGIVKSDLAVLDVEKQSQSTIGHTIENKDGIPVKALKREDMLQAELFLAKIEASQAKAKAFHSEAAITEQNAILQVRGLRHSALENEVASKELRQRSDQFWVRMTDLYGVDFKNAGYDDQTGIITEDPRVQAKT